MAAAGEVDPEHHRFEPGSAVLSDRVNRDPGRRCSGLGCAATSVFGIIRGGALAQGYAEADFPSIDEPIRFYVSALGGGGAPWGFVPLSVPEVNRPLIQPLRQAYELRAAVAGACSTSNACPPASGRRQRAFALVIELARVRDAIDRGVADAPGARDRQRHGQDRPHDRDATCASAARLATRGVSRRARGRTPGSGASVLAWYVA